MRKTEKGEPIEALALDYNPLGKKAPRVVAKGKGFVAERIIELARKTGVPIREDPVLVSLLSRLDIDQEIPPEAYQVVAELLAFVYKVHNQWKAETAGPAEKQTPEAKKQEPGVGRQ